MSLVNYIHNRLSLVDKKTNNNFQRLKLYKIIFLEVLILTEKQKVKDLDKKNKKIKKALEILK